MEIEYSKLEKLLNVQAWKIKKNKINVLRHVTVSNYVAAVGTSRVLTPTTTDAKLTAVPDDVFRPIKCKILKLK
jgi:hypothetical protein